MFGVGPLFLFLLLNRVPAGFLRDGWRPWASTMGTNLAIAVLVGALIWAVGLQTFLVVHTPIFLLGATAGVWLFYVQHQFEYTYWATAKQWNVHDAALYGSSHYDLPPLLRWFTANIGVHHVHHLCSQIPYYRLQTVLGDHPELRGISRLGLIESIKCIRLALWDEDTRQLISFKELRRRAAA
jgi:omega-6 fatty acid desaturase (delta-12 desaturase)